MKPTTWRAAMLSFIGLTSSLAIVSSLHLTPSGEFGFDGTPNAATHQILITNVADDSPAARAGIRKGDLVAPQDNFRERVRSRVPHPGDVIAFDVRHGNSVRSVRLTARAGNDITALGSYLVDLMKFLFLSMAALIAARRPDNPSARALTAFFVMFGFGVSIDYAWFRSPAVILACFILVESAYIVGGAYAVCFAALFPRKSSAGIRAVILRTIPYVAALGIVQSTIRLTAIVVYGAGGSAFYAGVSMLWAYYVLAAIACLLIALRQAEGAERQRLLWIFLTFASGFSGLLVTITALFLNMVTEYTNDAILTVLLIPIGLAYVILRHRVLDITFVINRAVVFAGVSVVVVGAFVALEWFLGKYFVEANHVTSILVELSVALGLGFSIRYVHNRIDRFVDDVFFRERHLAEAAIRRFAHEAALVSDMEVLLKRSVDVSLLYGKAQGAALFLARNGRFAPVRSAFADSSEITENDPAILSMRTWHEPIDLDSSESALPGALAIPMVVRGVVTGLLALGPKEGSEGYAPDERDAFVLLTHAVGTAIDALQTAALKREVARILQNPASFEEAKARLSQFATGGGAGAF